jgi:hypothetical protein
LKQHDFFVRPEPLPEGVDSSGPEFGKIKRPGFNYLWIWHAVEAMAKLGKQHHTQLRAR